MKKISSILVANRSEIAIRVMRAASELGIRTVAIFSNEDRFALHRFKADESYLVGSGKKPVAAYLDIADIIRIAKKNKVDAIHPGYGFLSENPEFAAACTQAGIIFIGPKAEVMLALGNKVTARALAQNAGVPVIPATKAITQDSKTCLELAEAIGYPLMIKASWGGGGRGMRPVQNAGELMPALESARREAKAAFGNDEVYLEKMLVCARHVEVQVIGDMHGQIVHLFERDCSVQRRNQKVIERAPAPYLNNAQRSLLYEYALNLTRGVHYSHAGTVEFLMDVDSGNFYFIEVNPRIQVEHTVTEEVTGLDIVKAQIRVSEGAKIGSDDYLPAQNEIRLQCHALQCRVTTEDPARGFTPDYGKLSAYRSASGAGIRLDAGTAYGGAIITPFYDSLLVKVTARGHDPEEAIRRMERALREFRIRGVSTNLAFLENIIAHPKFKSAEYTTRFIDTSPELMQFVAKRDRATRLLKFIGDVMVNGNPEMQERKHPALIMGEVPLPLMDANAVRKNGSRDLLQKLGREKFINWMRAEKQVLLTDTTMRDAHQSLFATRMRTYDMLQIAPAYAQYLPELFSLECWGGATFDVALRFLKEDPWSRLQQLRSAIPNVLFQMLLRGSNAVGYTNYADNVVRFFVREAAEQGIDIFRVFDSLNWVENMRVAMDAVIENGALCEAAICYTSDVLDPARNKYDLKYYVRMARELESAGAHILAIKDMAGVCRPAAARALVKALKDEVALPIHFHTHDTSGGSVASVLAAVEAGVDAVDGAIDAMSGLTSQPSLGAIIAALSHSEREPAIDIGRIATLSRYWEGVRQFYAPFEADMRSGTSDIYRHEMPGGQYTNLREQARAIGLGRRWNEIAQTYADVNQLFGDIVKVTPSSKVVGDMALFMVSHELQAEDVQNPDIEISFPDSVVSMMRGELGYPAGYPVENFPQSLQTKVLKGELPIKGRAGALLPPVDLELERSKAEKSIGRAITDCDLASWLMYPKVFSEYAQQQSKYGDVSVLPTPVFFYGMNERDEIAVDIDQGKTLIVRLIGKTSHDEEGEVKLFFELNGQPRPIRVGKNGMQKNKQQLSLAEEGNPKHVAAPMPGVVATIVVQVGQKLTKGSPMLTIEAMKMETSVSADRDAIISRILVASGDRVESKTLLIEYL